MHRKHILAGALALAGVTTAQAEDTGDADTEITKLDRLLISEGRTPVEAEKSGRAHTVIPGETLQQNRVRYVADALRMVPGVAVSRTGAYGGLTQLRMRGAEGNHVLVMIDGIEMNETSSGEFDFGSLLVDDIERIEVLRGPQSAFWGSNATAGVINIITKRGERNGFSTSIRSEAGTDGTWLGGLSMRGGGENYDVALSGLLRNTGGFNVSDYGTERDGDRNATMNGRFTVDLTPALSVDGTLRYVDRKSDLDAQDYGWGSPTYGQVLDTDDQVASRELFGSLGATHVAFDGALTQRLRFTGSDTFRENFAGGALTSSNSGARYNGLYQATWEFDTPSLLEARHRLTGGYEWERETFLPSHLTNKLARNTNSFVGEYRGEFLDQVSLNAALRRDDNDAFSDVTTYSLSAAWRIPGTDTRLHASLGTGVTNPTFFEQFGYLPTQFVGNPGLLPEESFGWDVGVEQGFFGGMLVVDLTYFNQDLTNEIATSYAGPLPTPVNLGGRSERQGVEVAATVDLFNGFTATATYTYTDATEQTVAGGPRLVEVRRPKHSGSLNTAYNFYDNRARVFGEVVFNGEMLDLDFSTFPSSRVRLKPYTVVNVGGSFRFNETVEGFARIENLFDEEYEDVLGYNTQGLVAFFGLKGSF
ncbi:TonB-dependent receptor [Nitratireductor sp. StC3]|uniref:TonB-dependent receptor plug domain-containing protein n=1 Tax=Nitratireductor sp. StC3 TaxID=2126741 RepID=UPI001304A566|nr:TonB-dependent receptor [Nitratireductor sp. StC3]